MVIHRLVVSVRSDGCFVAAQASDKLDVPKLKTLFAKQQPPTAFEKGLPVSLCDKLQHLDVQRLLTNQFFQAFILFFKLL